MIKFDSLSTVRTGGLFLMAKKHPSLFDVANLAGVSLSTASRVLGNSAYPVSAEIKKKVFAAADELRYYPGSQTAISPTPIIGVIVPTLQNPFFNEVTIGIEASASKFGYQIMVFSSHRSVEEERKNINVLLRTRVRALIIISIDSNSDTLDHFILCGGRVALLESDFKLKNSIIARTNYTLAGRLAAEHLISCGHRNIAFFSSPLTKSYRRAILLGVEETLKEVGTPLSEKSIFIAKGEKESDTGHYEFEMGKQLVQEFLPQWHYYTAIIAINDLTALGIIQALSQKGISIPGDISVISFDNIPYSGMIYPALTTIELPASSLGFTVCNMLINSLSTKEEGLSGIVFEYEGKLIERASVVHIHRAF